MKIKKIIAAPRAIFKIDIYLLIKYCLKCYKHRPRESLRKTIDGRNYLNFKVGSEKMNKELDISRIQNRILENVKEGYFKNSNIANQNKNRKTTYQKRKTIAKNINNLKNLK